MKRYSIVAMILFAGLLLTCVVASAQHTGGRHLIVALTEGGFVAFKSEMASTNANQTTANPKSLDGEFGSQAFVESNRVVHRLLTDNSGKIVFGYDLMIKPDASLKQFKITVKPLDSNTGNKLLRANSEAPGVSVPISTLPKSAEPQLLDDGDSFKLDLLVNEGAGIKIVDVVRRLEDAGDIIISGRGGESDLVV